LRQRRARRQLGRLLLLLLLILPRPLPSKPHLHLMKRSLMSPLRLRLPQYKVYQRAHRLVQEVAALFQLFLFLAHV
jgi:hypothetical protein